jgi:hypothetical protein
MYTNFPARPFFAPERRMILTLAQKCLKLGSILVLLQQSHSMLCGRSTLCLALFILLTGKLSIQNSEIDYKLTGGKLRGLTFIHPRSS